MTAGGDQPSGAAQEITLERYKYILQQIHALNENVYRFLAIYQTLATALVGAGLALFTGYERWGIRPSTARAGMVGLMLLVTVVAAFTFLLIAVGVLNWLDLRREECDLADTVVGPEFRSRPRVRNLFRWYETYVLLFILVSVGFLWVCTLGFLLPEMEPR